jgi:hypothetical protein
LLLLLPLLASKGCYSLPTCFLAVTNRVLSGSETSPFGGAHHAPSNRLRYVLQVLPSSLLGAVCFELVYHNVRKQQILRIARIKCNSKSKRKDRASQRFFAFWTHFEPSFEPLGWCALYSSTAGRKNRSRGL